MKNADRIDQQALSDLCKWMDAYDSLARPATQPIGRGITRQLASLLPLPRQATWRHARVVLEPINHAFKPITVTGEEARDLRLVAELAEVFGREAG